MKFRHWLRQFVSPQPLVRTNRPRLGVEPLESRDVPSVTLSVGNATATEGAANVRYTDDFVTANSGGLYNPHDVLFGPGGNDLYVASGFGEQVLRYDGHTGAFEGAVVSNGVSGITIDNPWALAWGPDGKLYVSGRGSGNVVRYDPATGGVDEFIPAGSGVWNPKSLAFGADGNLYVANADANTTDVSPLQDQVARFQGPNGSAPGQFIDTFIPRADHGLDNPQGLLFSGGYLYVANTRGDSVMRYDAATGAFHDVFVTPGAGGVNTPSHLTFHSGELYVTSQLTSQVMRYNAASGAFLGVLLTAGNSATDYTAGFDFDAAGHLYIAYNQKSPTGTGAPNTASDTYKVLRYAAESWAAFPVTLSAASSSAVTVDFTTGDGTAVAGSDYTAASGTLTFAPGETTHTILVQTLNDSIAEGTETFTVNLSNATGATVSAATGVGTITDDDATKFYVANDGTADQTYRYGAPGNGLATSALAGGDTAPRGAASTASGDKVWVVDANRIVFVYSAAGVLLGSWAAGSLAATADVQGITVWGSDVWLVDAKAAKVYKYAGAAARLSGSQTAVGSFALNRSNTNAKDLVTDGTSIWAVDDGSAADRVFKYTLAGSSVGYWTLYGGGGSPTGITLDPTGASQDLWVVDNATDTVYRYAAVRSFNGGTFAPASTFALAAGNTNPQGIADPPPTPAGAVANGPPLGPTPLTGRGLVTAAADYFLGTSNLDTHTASATDGGVRTETDTAGSVEPLAVEPTGTRGTSRGGAKAADGWGIAGDPSDVIHLTGVYVGATDFNLDVLGTDTRSGTRTSLPRLQPRQS